MYSTVHRKLPTNFFLSIQLHYRYQYTPEAIVSISLDEEVDAER